MIELNLPSENPKTGGEILSQPPKTPQSWPRKPLDKPNLEEIIVSCKTHKITL